MIRLEENQKRLEENIQENSQQIKELNENFDSFVQNHFTSFKENVIKELSSLKERLGNNTKLSWFLLSLLIGLYVLIIKILI